MRRAAAHLLFPALARVAGLCGTLALVIRDLGSRHGGERGAILKAARRWDDNACSSAPLSSAVPTELSWALSLPSYQTCGLRCPLLTQECTLRTCQGGRSSCRRKGVQPITHGKDSPVRTKRPKDGRQARQTGLGVMLLVGRLVSQRGTTHLVLRATPRPSAQTASGCTCQIR